MKEKKTLSARLFRRVKKSALKVDKRAKKQTKTMLKRSGYSPKLLKTGKKKPAPAEKAPEPAPTKAGQLTSLISLYGKASKAAGRLRTTGGRTLFPRKKN